MIRRRRGAVAVRSLLVAPLAVLTLTSCGDGTPAFCAPLAESSDLGSLADALAGDDLSAATAEARRLSDLAESAPTEIRADLTALADAVADIVLLLEQEERAAGTATDDDPPEVSPAQIERRREDLNARFGDLDRRATRVSVWAAEECGIDLG